MAETPDPQVAGGRLREAAKQTLGGRLEPGPAQPDAPSANTGGLLRADMPAPSPAVSAIAIVAPI